MKNEKRYVIVFDVKMVLCNNTRKVGSKLKKGIKTLAMWLIIGVIAIVLITSIMENRSSQITYSELITSIENGEVEKIKISSTGSQATVKMKDSKLEKEVSIPSLDSFMTYSQDYLKTGAFSLEEEKESIWITVLSLITPFGLLIIFFIFWFFMMSGANSGNAGSKTMSFGKSKARIMTPADRNKITFDDVAGVDEEKEELEEIVEFLKNPKKFTDMGARIPKGVLLVGQPGTGKTLLAKAVAGEAGVPFYIISGSDFVEMFVGVGASRVRDLFEQAKKNAPCIIFIDEIDAVGRQRGAGLGGGHDEREQTLNQLLVEMDGFSDNEGVIILAATNRPDVLDKALLRAGRFDRQIVVGSPDVKAREQILEVHARKKKLADDVSLYSIAEDTAGFTGAELANILNEAAIIATKNQHNAITNDDLDEAVKKVTVGLEKTSRKISDKDKKLTAYHEAGHAIVSQFLPTQTAVKEISIVPRGVAGGYTMYKSDEDKSFISKTEMEEKLIALLGGRAAEKIVLDDISTGASNDIEVATEIAKNMVTVYGMSDVVGPICLKSSDGNYEYQLLGNNMEDIIGQEVKKLIDTAYKSAQQILLQNMDLLHAIAAELIAKEKINEEEFNKFFMQ